LPIPQGFDSLQLSLQVTDKHLFQTPGGLIQIDSFRYPVFSTPIQVKQQFAAARIKTLSFLPKFHTDEANTFRGEGWLPGITVKSIKKEETYDVSRRISPVSYVVTNDKFRYGGPDALGNAMLMVPGVTLLSGDLSIFGMHPSLNSNGSMVRPLIIMDGYAFPSQNVMGFLNTLNPADIDFIEVLRGGEAAQYGSRGGGGVISINTKHGPNRDNSPNNFRAVSPVTYHVCPKFEMPDYSNKEIKNSSIPDPRTTIYWNGNITTDTNGEASINFYTGDDATNYTNTVTGLTKNRELVYKRIVIGNSGKLQ